LLGLCKCWQLYEIRFASFTTNSLTQLINSANRSKFLYFSGFCSLSTSVYRSFTVLLIAVSCALRVHLGWVAKVELYKKVRKSCEQAVVHLKSRFERGLSTAIHIFTHGGGGGWANIGSHIKMQCKDAINRIFILLYGTPTYKTPL
jgi:hypothetical protein